MIHPVKVANNRKLYISVVLKSSKITIVFFGMLSLSKHLRLCAQGFGSGQQSYSHSITSFPYRVMSNRDPARVYLRLNRSSLFFRKREKDGLYFYKNYNLLFPERNPMPLKVRSDYLTKGIRIISCYSSKCLWMISVETEKSIIV